MLKCFFSYFGAKYRSGRMCLKPLHPILIEPFAGAAGYSVRYCHLRVHLYDIDPIIYGIWNYLIRAKESEILSLPEAVVDTQLLAVPQEAKWLIGFWINPGSSVPKRTPTSWCGLAKDLGCHPRSAMVTDGSQYSTYIEAE